MKNWVNASSCHLFRGCSILPIISVLGGLGDICYEKLSLALKCRTGRWKRMLLLMCCHSFSYVSAFLEAGKYSNNHFQLSAVKTLSPFSFLFLLIHEFPLWVCYIMSTHLTCAKNLQNRHCLSVNIWLRGVLFHIYLREVLPRSLFFGRSASVFPRTQFPAEKRPSELQACSRRSWRYHPHRSSAPSPSHTLLKHSNQTKATYSSALVVMWCFLYHVCQWPFCSGRFDYDHLIARKEVC